MIQLAIAGESVSRDQAQQSTGPVQVSRQERRADRINGGAGNDLLFVDEAEAHPDQGSEFNGEDKKAPPPSNSNAPSLTNNRERRDAILKDVPATFPISENPDADGDEPWFEWPAMSAVGDYKDLIEQEAEEASVDPDLIKAIVYMETTHGYYDRIKDAFSEPGTLRPMNVNVEYWKGIGVSREQLEDPKFNIKTGIKIVKGISERLKHGNVRKIATLYNNLAAEKVTDYGARVERLYRERPWENE
ncbi:lytic transglycosylase domain-containing protein [Marivibrio halodurans]|uniref:Lytic transglycosylase domain-containing protein n=1 Tax=Marivibrio halodurans TaxID=2039722 RepID=A0A8J7V0R3_9PROT|nr:lytic transglycosylase domain-containing protein [Marivibrio halodurans]MBP5857056.1 lytic transglycosylase domain-containing protein [Marivibrio halodurans]